MTPIKHRWARVSLDGGYGRWVPTGQPEHADAYDYITLVYGYPVKEWLLL